MRIEWAVGTLGSVVFVNPGVGNGDAMAGSRSTFDLTADGAYSPLTRFLLPTSPSPYIPLPIYPPPQHPSNARKGLAEIFDKVPLLLVLGSQLVHQCLKCRVVRGYLEGICVFL
jgi:hypothetical protein